MYEKLCDLGIQLPQHQLISRPPSAIVKQVKTPSLPALARLIPTYSIADILGYLLACDFKSLKTYMESVEYPYDAFDCEKPSRAHHTGCSCPSKYIQLGYTLNSAIVRALSTWNSMPVSGCLTPDNTGSDGCLFDYEDISFDEGIKECITVYSLWHLAFSASGCDMISSPFLSTPTFSWDEYTSFAEGFVSGSNRITFEDFVYIISDGLVFPSELELYEKYLKEDDMTLFVYLGYRSRYDSNKPAKDFKFYATLDSMELDAPDIGRVKIDKTPVPYFLVADAVTLTCAAVPGNVPSDLFSSNFIGTLPPVHHRPRPTPAPDLVLLDYLSKVYDTTFGFSPLWDLLDGEVELPYGLPKVENESCDFSKFEGAISPGFTDGMIQLFGMHITRQLDAARKDYSAVFRAPPQHLDLIKHNNQSSAGPHFGKNATYKVTYHEDRPVHLAALKDKLVVSTCVASGKAGSVIKYKGKAYLDKIRSGEATAKDYKPTTVPGRQIIAPTGPAIDIQHLLTQNALKPLNRPNFNHGYCGGIPLINEHFNKYIFSRFLDLDGRGMKSFSADFPSFDAKASRTFQRIGWFVMSRYTDLDPQHLLNIVNASYLSSTVAFVTAQNRDTGLEELWLKTNGVLSGSAATAQLNFCVAQMALMGMALMTGCSCEDDDLASLVGEAVFEGRSLEECYTVYRDRIETCGIGDDVLGAIPECFDFDEFFGWAHHFGGYNMNGKWQSPIQEYCSQHIVDFEGQKLLLADPLRTMSSAVCPPSVRKDHLQNVIRLSGLLPTTVTLLHSSNYYKRLFWVLLEYCRNQVKDVSDPFASLDARETEFLTYVTDPATLFRVYGAGLPMPPIPPQFQHLFIFEVEAGTMPSTHEQDDEDNLNDILDTLVGPDDDHPLAAASAQWKLTTECSKSTHLSCLNCAGRLVINGYDNTVAQTFSCKFAKTAASHRIDVHHTSPCLYCAGCSAAKRMDSTTTANVHHSCGVSAACGSEDASTRSLNSLYCAGQVERAYSDSSTPVPHAAGADDTTAQCAGRLECAVRTHDHDACTDTELVLEAGEMAICLYCSSPAVFKCYTCNIFLCHLTAHSDAELHLKKFPHHRYFYGRKALRCSLCLDSNINELRFHKQQFFCVLHSPRDSKPIVSDGSLAFVRLAHTSLLENSDIDVTAASARLLYCHMKAKGDIRYLAPIIVTTHYLNDQSSRAFKVRKICDYLLDGQCVTRIHDFGHHVTGQYTYQGNPVRITNYDGTVTVHARIKEDEFTICDVTSFDYRAAYQRISSCLKHNTELLESFVDPKPCAEIPLTRSGIVFTHNICRVVGPPGTGKTALLVDLACKLKGKKIVCIAESHAACDNIAQRMYAEGLPVNRYVSDKATYVPNVHPTAIKPRRFDIVVCTTKTYYENFKADYLLVDEAALSSADMEIVNLLRYLRNGGKAIYVGDPKQRAPIYQEEVEYRVSSFYNFNTLDENGRLVDNAYMLSINYRNPANAVYFISDKYYNERLSPATTTVGVFTLYHLEKIALEELAHLVYAYAQDMGVSVQILGMTHVFANMINVKRAMFANTNIRVARTLDSYQGSEDDHIIVVFADGRITDSRINVGYSRHRQSLTVFTRNARGLLLNSIRLDSGREITMGSARMRVYGDYAVLEGGVMKIGDIKEKRGDLTRQRGVIAYSMTQDCAFDTDISRKFDNSFGLKKSIDPSTVHVGGIVTTLCNDRIIYGLCTRPDNTAPPEYENIRSCLVKMRDHLIGLKNRYGNYICVPRFDCELKDIQWPVVKDIMAEVFHDSNIYITSYKEKVTARTVDPTKILRNFADELDIKEPELLYQAGKRLKETLEHISPAAASFGGAVSIDVECAMSAGTNVLFWLGATAGGNDMNQLIWPCIASAGYAMKLHSVKDAYGFTCWEDNKKLMLSASMRYPAAMAKFVMFVHRNTVDRTVFVLFSGGLDLGAIAPAIVTGPNMQCSDKCASIASFINRSGKLSCHRHATRPVKFYNPQVVELWTTGSPNLSMQHAEFCSDSHGVAHEPLADSHMTMCVFANRKPLVIHQGMYSPPYNTYFFRKYLAKFFAENTDYNFYAGGKTLGPVDRNYDTLYKNDPLPADYPAIFLDSIDRALVEDQPIPAGSYIFRHKKPMKTVTGNYGYNYGKYTLYEYRHVDLAATKPHFELKNCEGGFRPTVFEDFSASCGEDGVCLKHSMLLMRVSNYLLSCPWVEIVQIVPDEEAVLEDSSAGISFPVVSKPNIPAVNGIEKVHLYIHTLQAHDKIFEKDKVLLVGGHRNDNVGWCAVRHESKTHHHQHSVKFPFSLACSDRQLTCKHRSVGPIKDVTETFTVILTDWCPNEVEGHDLCIFNNALSALATGGSFGLRVTDSIYKVNTVAIDQLADHFDTVVFRNGLSQTSSEAFLIYMTKLQAPRNSTIRPSELYRAWRTNVPLALSLILRIPILIPNIPLFPMKGHNVKLDNRTCLPINYG